MSTISVIMGVYREKEAYLRLAIESILAQTFSDFEFIIVLDDPTNEAQKKVLHEYQNKDKRITVLVNDGNIGLAMSLNRGLAISTGSLIARMDADDIAINNRLEYQVRYMELHPEIDILGTNKIIIDEQNNEIAKGGKLPETPPQNIRMLKYVNVIVHPSVIMRKECIMSIGGYRDFPTSQDFDLWLRAIDSGLKIGNLNEYLIRYRINSQGISMGKSYKQAVIGRYIRTLHNERQRSGSDSFSKENLRNYIESCHVDDENAAKAYQNAREKFEKARVCFKKRQLGQGLRALHESKKLHPYMKQTIRNTFISILLKKTL